MPRYTTLLLGNPGGGFKALGRYPGLLVPRKDSFWRIGAVRTCEYLDDDRGVQGEGLWSAPAGQQVTIELPTSKERPGPCKDPTDVCAWHQAAVEFLWPDWLSLRSHGEAVCERTADWDGGELVPIEDVSRSPGRDDLAHARRAFGRRLIGPFERGLADAIRVAEAQRTDEDDCHFFPEGQNWSAHHGRGRVWLKATPASSPNCAFSFDFPVPENARPRWTRGNGRAVAWQQIEKRIRKPVDAFGFPDGSWTLVVQGDKVQIYEGLHAAGEALLTVPLERKTRVIMAEFTTRVMNWDRDLRQAAAQAIPAPRFIRPR